MGLCLDKCYNQTSIEPQRRTNIKTITKPYSMSNRTIGKIDIVVVRNEVTDERVDAIAYSTNTHLNHNARLLRKAGRELQIQSSRHIHENNPLKPGETFVGIGGDLSCGWIIH
jgi:hypothetical protein